MSKRDKLAKAHAESEGDNGNADISFKAGWDAAVAEAVALLCWEGVSMSKPKYDGCECCGCQAAGLLSEKML